MLNKTNGLLLSSLLVVIVSGCASSSNKNAQEVIDYDANTDYRQTENKLSSSLDVPPDLFLRVVKTNDEKLLSVSQKELAQKSVPNFQSNNAQIKQNLTEKWLELKNISNKDAWLGVQSFFTSLGFSIKEKRLDIGYIKTDFLARTELVPLSTQGPLTRLLNSWRPELAEGANDRLVARIETDEASGITRVYFYHYMISTALESEGFSQGGDWVIKPFNPMYEAEALFQAAIFFGSTDKIALQQIETNTMFIEGVEESEKEFAGINFKASQEKSWDYFMAMVYRAGWTTEDVKKSHFTVNVNLPNDEKNVRQKTVSFAFNVKKIDGKSFSSLSVSSNDSEQPLSEAERKYLFKKLGLL